MAPLKTASMDKDANVSEENSPFTLISSDDASSKLSKTQTPDVVLFIININLYKDIYRNPNAPDYRKTSKASSDL